MSTAPDHIPGGCVLLARMMLDSDLMRQSPLVMKLFIWFLLKANWKDRNQLARGQLVTTIQEMREAMAHYSGWRKVVPSPDEIRSAYGALTKAARITVRRTTRGVVVTVLNYDVYQDFERYASRTEPHAGNVKEPAATPHDTETRKAGRKKEPREERAGAAKRTGDPLVSRSAQQIRDSIEDHADFIAQHFPHLNIVLETEEMVAKYGSQSIGAEPWLIVLRWLRNKESSDGNRGPRPPGGVGASAAEASSFDDPLTKEFCSRSSAGLLG